MRGSGPRPGGVGLQYLKQRDLRIRKLHGQGVKTMEIANRMGISYRTVTDAVKRVDSGRYNNDGQSA